MLSVHKIGGTSMSKFEDVLRNIIIGQSKEGDPYKRIFVVSAYNRSYTPGSPLFLCSSSQLVTLL